MSLEEEILRMRQERQGSDILTNLGLGIASTQPRGYSQGDWKDALVASVLTGLLGGGMAGFGQARLDEEARKDAARGIQLRNMMNQGQDISGLTETGRDARIVSALLEESTKQDQALNMLREQMKVKQEFRDPLLTEIGVGGESKQRALIDTATGEITKLGEPIEPSRYNQFARPALTDDMRALMSEELGKELPAGTSLGDIAQIAALRSLATREDRAELAGKKFETELAKDEASQKLPGLEVIPGMRLNEKNLKNITDIQAPYNKISSLIDKFRISLKKTDGASLYGGESKVQDALFAAIIKEAKNLDNMGANFTGMEAGLQAAGLPAIPFSSVSGLVPYFRDNLLGRASVDQIDAVLDLYQATLTDAYRQTLATNKAYDPYIPYTDEQRKRFGIPSSGSEEQVSDEVDEILKMF